MLPRCVFLFGGLLASPLWLTGCDLIAAGPLMPGLMPGVGRPIVGTVLDARTRLPVGNATVVSGLGSTMTDAEGRFSLYGNLGSRELSVSRAGYTAVTIGGEPLDPDREIPVALSPQFPQAATLKNRVIELNGQVALAAGQNGAVFFGDKHAEVSNGRFQIRYESPVPGKILTSVLAWGALQGTYQEQAAADQPFHFRTFGYEVKHWALGDTYPEATRALAAPLVAQPNTPFTTVRVNYTNTLGFTSVQTDIALDFGVAGAVPVARATASNQSISVPQIAGLKYVIHGQALDGSRRLSSSVSITTNDPSKANFQLLSPPKVQAPAPGATQAGPRPTFRWSPVGATGVLYEVSLYEGDPRTDVFDSRPKWVCRTTDSEVQYPGFAINDVNGGALRPDKKYSWVVKAIDLLEADESPTFRRDGPSVKPYRVRKRESEARGNTFTP